MPTPKSRGRYVGPASYKRHPDLPPLPPALRDLLDDATDPDLFRAVCTGLLAARANGEDPADPNVAAWIVATARADQADAAA